MKTSFLTTSLVLATAFVLSAVQPAVAATNLYPDLKTLPPRDISYDTEEINGSTHIVLRFANTVWNAGQGPLEIYGTRYGADRTQVVQRVYSDDGRSTDTTVGYVVFHEAHNHWHFEDFAEYQLWTKADYDRWVANGRSALSMRFRGYKTTFCIRDTELVQRLPGTPNTPSVTECNQEKQGLAVGWGDTYASTLPEQWIDLGNSYLSDGDYVLRSIADPRNLLKESPTNDPAREGAVANEAVTTFSVRNNQIVPYTTPQVSPTPPQPSIYPTRPPVYTWPSPSPYYPRPSYNYQTNQEYIRQLEEMRARLLQLRQNLTTYRSMW